jgi:predicted TIM-barrel fold metal-dependent hydrolase
MPKSFAESPLDTLRRHVFVAPYYEDDIAKLAEVLGVEHVLLGSDWPHAEGLAEPTHFVRDLEGFAPAAVRRIMRENTAGLVQPLGSRALS